MVKSVGSLSEFEAELKSAGEKLIVVDFSATWCGPCKMIKPFFHSLCEKYGDVVFIEIDVDDAQDVATHCDVKCMPTFQFYKNGKKESQGEHHGKVSPKIGHQWPNYPSKATQSREVTLHSVLDKAGQKSPTDQLYLWRIPPFFSPKLWT
ncbi:thioredoxin isoform X3 [Rissa tridactyla]|uniref:thioredoxin isoform X3 n=1 Tax=Rissa tridactyla TaxID=75485 RepID=UPI0023BAD266|nr:thioredoxin isoform X3 [Rissa tridactyla]